MNVKLRKSKNDEWGFLESYSTYRYVENGSVTVTVGVTVEGKLTTPYVYRGEEFVPLSQIEEEIGIDRYINAKKPFYSKLSDGFIATIKAGLNYETGELLPESTTYTVYKTDKIEQNDKNSATLHLQRILEIPERVDVLMLRLAKSIAECKGEREVYLRSRL